MIAALTADRPSTLAGRVALVIETALQMSQRDLYLLRRPELNGSSPRGSRQ